MQNENANIQEVAQPLSQGEKNFKAMHKIALNKSVVPGVTDQEHVFKGNPRKMDQPTASREIYKSEDESKENYDKGLKRKEDYYATEEVVDEASLSAKAARAGKDIGAPGKNFSKIAAAASKKYGSDIAGERVAGAILKKMRANEEVESVEEVVVEPIVEKKAALKGYKAKLDDVGKEDADIDNDGDTDKSDEYLHNRRKAIKAAMKEEAEDLDEKTLTDAEMKKREEVVKAIKRENPDMDKSMAYAIATKTAKRVAEEKELGPESKIKDNKHRNASDYVKKNAKFEKEVTTAVKGIKEEADIDYEGEMAKAELRAICDKADKLANMMSDDMQLEAWLQSKISRAKDYIDAVYDYLNYREPAKETMPEVPMATQAPMATNYASFLNRMGEETSAINKAKKAFESKLIELGLEPALKKEVVETVEEKEEALILSDEETARIKEILEKE